MERENLFPLRLTPGERSGLQYMSKHTGQSQSKLLRDGLEIVKRRFEKDFGAIPEIPTDWSALAGDDE